MNIWLSLSLFALAAVIFLLLVKIRLMQKSAKEIREGLSEKLSHDTNTLICLSSRDRFLRGLADDLNGQLSALRSQRRKYLQGDAALKEAVTNISHDIRTPLTAICGYLDLLDQEETSATVRQYLAVIRERAGALKDLTEELFLYTVFVSSSPLPGTERVVLNHAIEESLAAHYAVLKGCRITPDIFMPDRDVVCMLNRRSLSRIFENLISNAVKYSSGDLSIRLSEDGTVEFSNRAEGLGKVQAEKLFHRLYTVETASSATGLGLAIAKELTEQMRGNISLQYENETLSIFIQFSPAGPIDEPS